MNFIINCLHWHCVSRHSRTSLSYNFSTCSRKNEITSQGLRNIDLRSLENELLDIPWNLIFNLPTVEQQSYFLRSNMQNFYEKYVPIRTKRPWLSYRIKSLNDGSDKGFLTLRIFLKIIEESLITRLGLLNVIIMATKFQPPYHCRVNNGKWRTWEFWMGIAFLTVIWMSINWV